MAYPFWHSFSFQERLNRGRNVAQVNMFALCHGEGGCCSTTFPCYLVNESSHLRTTMALTNIYLDWMFNASLDIDNHTALCYNSILYIPAVSHPKMFRELWVWCWFIVDFSWLQIVWHEHISLHCLHKYECILASILLASFWLTHPCLCFTLMLNRNRQQLKYWMFLVSSHLVNSDLVNSHFVNSHLVNSHLVNSHFVNFPFPLGQFPFGQSWQSGNW